MTETPVLVGRYHIARLIAHGGMGSLYLARDPAIDRLVAIKLLKGGFDDAVRERFAREARATGRLRHPNIVTVFDVGEHEDRPFIAMEYVPGETLAQMIERRAPIHVSDKLAILEDLCAGLHYAHEAGIVHRDIKPANVILDTSGTLKILDFGIARGGEVGITRAGDFVGTLNYMSPEQITGENVDRRTDVYAVGALAYELVSYQRAFPGTIQDGALFRILHSAPAPLESLVPGIDAEIAEILGCAMAREPGERYQDLDELRQDLDAVRNRLVERAPVADPAIDSNAETRNDPGGLARLIQPSTPTPGRPSPDQPPSGTPGSSSVRRRTSASSASRRRPASNARSAAGVADPKSGVGRAVRSRLVPLGAIAGMLAVMLALVIIWMGPWGRSPESGAGRGTAPPRPAETPAPPAGSSDADSRRAIEERVSSIRATARRQIAAGQPQQALDTLSAGLVLDASHTDLTSLLEELKRGAEQMAGQARLAASRRGATEQSSLEFREARAREREADSLESAGDRARATRALWAAAGLYERASRVAAPDTKAAAAAQRAPRTESEKTATLSTPERQPSAPPAQPQESLTTLPGTMEKPVAPPVPPKQDPATPMDPARSQTGEAVAIRDTLHRYADAYRSRNIAAVSKVVPSLSSDELNSLGRDFSNYRRFNVVIEDERILVDGSAGTGTVTCRVTRSFVTRTGVAGGNTVTQVFHVRKVDGAWIVERVESR